MKNHFLSRFDADNLRKTCIYFVIALPLIIISLALDIDENGLATCMFLFGIPFFFYALLRPWANAKYYGIMCIIFLLLILITCLVLANVIFVKIHLGKNYEDLFGWFFSISLAGFIAGIIGIFRFRKSD
jgi:hypothetical protein